jgi:predicted enzyme related to lactoylglutathione lyase
MLDNEYEPVEDFDLTKDVYTQFYGWNIDQKDMDSHLKKTKNRHKKYKVKVLFKRYY